MAPTAAKRKMADEKVASEVLPKKGRLCRQAAYEMADEKVASEVLPKKGRLCRQAAYEMADEKVASEVLPKKGRLCRQAAYEVEPEIEEPELIEKFASEMPIKAKEVAESNGIEKTNGSSEDVPTNTGRNKNAVVQNANEEYGDSRSEKAESPAPDLVESPDSKGHVKEPTELGNKKKKTGKKDPAKKPDSKTDRGKKNGKQESLLTSETDDAEEKPKPAAKGKGRKAQPKPEESENTETSEEETEPVTATKGRKKAVKAKSLEVEEEQKANANENSEEESKPEPTAAVKGKKKPKAESPEAERFFVLCFSFKAENKPEEEPSTKNRNTNKDKKRQGDTKVEQENAILNNLKRGLKKVLEFIEDSDQESDENGESNSKRNRKIDDDKDDTKVEDESVILNKPKPKAKRGHKKVTEGIEDADQETHENGESNSKRKPKIDDDKDDTKVEVESVILNKPKPKAKRGHKKVTEGIEDADQETHENGESNSKRKPKIDDDKAPADKKNNAPFKTTYETDYEQIDLTNASTNSTGKEWNFKIASWNVDGLRAWINKGGLEYLKHEKPDILCLQEVKCSKDKLPYAALNLPGYYSYWLCGDNGRYAGVGIYTTKLAMNVQYGLQNEQLDSEDRIITAEYEDFYLICTLVPKAGKNLVSLPKRLEWNAEFRKHVQQLDKKKPVIICGDMNVAHNEIDLANPIEHKKKVACLTQEERSGMSDLLSDGFVDVYRKLNPETTGAYTYWSYIKDVRAKNVGWRLDYFIVSERLLSAICDSVIRSQVYGSDHCPISLFLHLNSAE